MIWEKFAKVWTNFVNLIENFKSFSENFNKNLEKFNENFFSIINSHSLISKTFMPANFVVNFLNTTLFTKLLLL